MKGCYGRSSPWCSISSTACIMWSGRHYRGGCISNRKRCSSGGRIRCKPLGFWRNTMCPEEIIYAFWEVLVFSWKLGERKCLTNGTPRSMCTEQFIKTWLLQTCQVIKLHMPSSRPSQDGNDTSGIKPSWTTVATAAGMESTYGLHFSRQIYLPVNASVRPTCQNRHQYRAPKTALFPMLVGCKMAISVPFHPRRAIGLTP